MAVAETQRLGEMVTQARSKLSAAEDVIMQDRLYRALLRLLPREVRDAYARDMTATFRSEAAARGRHRRGVLAILGSPRSPTSSAPRPATTGTSSAAICATPGGC